MNTFAVTLFNIIVLNNFLLNIFCDKFKILNATSTTTWLLIATLARPKKKSKKKKTRNLLPHICNFFRDGNLPLSLFKVNCNSINQGGNVRL